MEKQFGNWLAHRKGDKAVPSPVKESSHKVKKPAYRPLTWKQKMKSSRGIYGIAMGVSVAVALLGTLLIGLASTGVIGKTSKLENGVIETPCIDNTKTCVHGSCQSGGVKGTYYCKCNETWFGEHCDNTLSMLIQELGVCSIISCPPDMSCDPDMYGVDCILPTTPFNMTLEADKHIIVPDDGKATEASQFIHPKNRSDMDYYALEELRRDMTISLIFDVHDVSSCKGFDFAKESRAMQVDDEAFSYWEESFTTHDSLPNVHIRLRLYSSPGVTMTVVLLLNNFTTGSYDFFCSNCDYIGEITSAHLFLVGVPASCVFSVDKAKFTNEQYLRFYSNTTKDYNSVYLLQPYNCHFQKQSSNYCMLSKTSVVLTQWSVWTECNPYTATRHRYRFIKEKVPVPELPAASDAIEAESLWEQDPVHCTSQSSTLKDSDLYTLLPCKGEKARCIRDNFCIEKTMICDGVKDCMLNEDETDCGEITNSCEGEVLPGKDQLGRGYNPFPGDDHKIRSLIFDMDSTRGSCKVVSIGGKTYIKPFNVLDYNAKQQAEVTHVSETKETAFEELEKYETIDRMHNDVLTSSHSTYSNKPAIQGYEDFYNAASWPDTPQYGKYPSPNKYNTERPPLTWNTRDGLTATTGAVSGLYNIFQKGQSLVKCAKGSTSQDGQPSTKEGENKVRSFIKKTTSSIKEKAKQTFEKAKSFGKKAGSYAKEKAKSAAQKIGSYAKKTRSKVKSYVDRKLNRNKEKDSRRSSSTSSSGSSSRSLSRSASGSSSKSSRKRKKGGRKRSKRGVDRGVDTKGSTGVSRGTDPSEPGPDEDGETSSDSCKGAGFNPAAPFSFVAEQYDTIHKRQKERRDVQWQIQKDKREMGIKHEEMENEKIEQKNAILKSQFEHQKEAAKSDQDYMRVAYDDAVQRTTEKNEYLQKFDALNLEKSVSQTHKISHGLGSSIVKKVQDYSKQAISISGTVTVAEVSIKTQDQVLSKTFHHEVLRLPPFFHKSYVDFLETFGTHYISNMVIGGNLRISYLYERQSKKNQTMLKDRISKCLGADSQQNQYMRQGSAEKNQVEQEEYQEYDDKDECKKKLEESDESKAEMESSEYLTMIMDPVPVNLGSTILDLSSLKAGTYGGAVSSWVTAAHQSPRIISVKDLRPICDLFTKDNTPNSTVKQFLCRKASYMLQMSTFAPCFCGQSAVPIETPSKHGCTCVIPPDDSSDPKHETCTVDSILVSNPKTVIGRASPMVDQVSIGSSLTINCQTDAPFRYSYAYHCKGSQWEA